MRSKRATTGASDRDRERLEALFLALQRERIGLTSAIMRLREEVPLQRPRLVVKIIIALLRLQRANHQAMAALDVTLPTGDQTAVAP